MNRKGGYFLVVAVLSILFLGGWWVMTDSGEPEETPPTVTEEPKEEEINPEEAREVAVSFLRVFLSSGDVRPYVTQGFYEEMRRFPQRPTAEAAKQELVEVTKTYLEQADGDVTWSIQAVIKVTDGKGKTREEEWLYVVTLTQEEGWKVKGVTVRGVPD